jgi:hypothetical protein
MSMPDHAEDPLAAAGARVAGYVTVAVVVAEAAAQIGAARARDRAAVDEQRTAALRAGHQGDYARARLDWAPILDPTLRGQTGVRAAGLVWARAQQWRPDPEAERVSTLAEDRLRTLRPDVMARYDRLRAEGADPIAAMRRVADAFDAPTARTGQPAPARAALTERDRTRRAGDAELVPYRAGTAAVVLAAESYPGAVVGADAAAQAPAVARSLTAAAVQAHPGPAAATVAGRIR